METKSLGENWRIAQQRLASVGVESARLEARFLVEHVVDCRYSDLLAHPDRQVSTVPVSYTHLDVYKRQGQGRLGRKSSRTSVAALDQ